MTDPQPPVPPADGAPPVPPADGATPPVPPADGVTPPPAAPVPPAEGYTPPADGYTPPAAPTAPPAGPTPPPAQPAYPAYGQPAQGYYAPPTNTLAILALVFAFVIAPGGIICGHIALGQIKRTGEGGRGLAMAGLIIGYIFTGIFVLYIIGIIIFAIWAASMGAAYSTYY